MHLSVCCKLSFIYPIVNCYKTRCCYCDLTFSQISLQTFFVHVCRKLDFDFRTDHQYRFNVTAKDKGEIPRSGMASVIVYVTNVNDERPVFGIGSDHLLTKISEEQTAGSVVTIIQATDHDGDNIKYYFTRKSDLLVTGCFYML